MELANGTAHRALAYVAAIQHQGYLMTVEEFEAYMVQADRRPGIAGTPEQRVVSTNISRAIDQAVAPALRGLAATVAKGLDAREERVIPATPGTPTESIVDWLTRLRWLNVDDGRVRTTPLGDAMRGHLEQASLEEEIPVGVVLDQGDELATARVIQQIADIGPCALVDRYFSMESLLPILYSTEVEAVLMGADAGNKIPGVETALRDIVVERPFEVRKSNVFHDRFVIPPHGPVWALGTSLSGLSRRLSIMVRIDDARMSDAIRRELTEAWDEAAVVSAKRPVPMPDTSSGADPDPQPEPGEGRQRADANGAS